MYHEPMARLTGHLASMLCCLAISACLGRVVPLDAAAEAGIDQGLDQGPADGGADSLVDAAADGSADMSTDVGVDSQDSSLDMTPDQYVGPTVTISGTLSALEIGMPSVPIANATIEVFGEPQFTATTAADGQYSIEAPQNRVVFLLARAPTFYGVLTGIPTTTQDISNFNMAAWKETNIDLIAANSGTARNPTKGWIIFEFADSVFGPAEHIGGERAVVSGTPFQKSVIVLPGIFAPSDTLTATSLNFILYLNVDPTAAATIDITPPACTPIFPAVTQYPVAPNTHTQINVSCDYTDAGVGDAGPSDGSDATTDST